VETSALFIPLHRQPAYRHLAQSGACPNAERVASRIVALPIHPAMTNADVTTVIDAVHTVREDLRSLRSIA
jgi:dTDP-4-amino-4,6-dideoxygalactose transaminase